MAGRLSYLRLFVALLSRHGLFKSPFVLSLSKHCKQGLRQAQAERYSRLFRAGSIVAMAVLVPSVSAQGLPDPTRPAVGDNATSENGSATAAASVGLQTIIRRKGAKPAAIINGEYVELGGRVGESRLTVIGDDSVVLNGPSGKETLALTPGIKKKPTRPMSGDKALDKLAGKARKQVRTE